MLSPGVVDVLRFLPGNLSVAVGDRGDDVRHSEWPSGRWLRSCRCWRVSSSASRSGRLPATSDRSGSTSEPLSPARCRQPDRPSRWRSADLHDGGIGEKLVTVLAPFTPLVKAADGLLNSWLLGGRLDLLGLVLLGQTSAPAGLPARYAGRRSAMPYSVLSREVPASRNDDEAPSDPLMVQNCSWFRAASGLGCFRCRLFPV